MKHVRPAKSKWIVDNASFNQIYFLYWLYEDNGNINFCFDYSLK